jgi:hypothetical protein
VATQTFIGDYLRSLTTSGIEVTEGKHYWEVELLSENITGIYIGTSRLHLDLTADYIGSGCTDGWFISAYNGALCGNGKNNDDQAGSYKQGDRVGMMLDLGNGSLRFFKNGAQHGPGFPAGRVTGPVVAAVQMSNEDHSVRMLPDIEAPANMRMLPRITGD